MGSFSGTYNNPKIVRGGGGIDLINHTRHLGTRIKARGKQVMKICQYKKSRSRLFIN